MKLKAICPDCHAVYRGWALEQEEHLKCSCGTKLVIVTDQHRALDAHFKTLLKAVRR